MVYSPSSPSSASASGSINHNINNMPAPPPLDDIPPSYESVASSSSKPSGSEEQAPWPANMNPLFNGPPNAEPAISRDRIAALPNITMKTMFNRQEVCDSRLESADALYDFLRAQAMQAPKVQLRCVARHQETAPRQMHVVTPEGVPRVVQAGQRYSVTDFDFTIDLTNICSHDDNNASIALFTHSTQAPVRRGGLSRSYGASFAPFAGTHSAGRTPTREEKNRWEAWEKFRRERGRAPWADMASDDEFWAQYNRDGTAGVALGGRESDEEALLSSQPGENETALRAWCEAYCSNPGLLKSFKLSKDVWGWDVAGLRKAITTAILATGYIPTEDGSITVDLQYKDADIIVRPDNMLSRFYWLNQPWFLMVLFFWVTPLIWIWSHIDQRRAGGPYEVAVASYGLKVYPPLPGTYANERVEQAKHRLPGLFKLYPFIPKDPFLQQGPKGVHYLLGRKEGEWFREWEERIRMAVRMKFHGELTDTRVFEEDPPELDGY